MNDILRCVRKDLKLIILAAILLGIVSGAVGRLTNLASSSAQLVLTPIPLRAKANADDAFANMLASPLDVTTLSLLCTSDEVMQKTMDRLNDNSGLSGSVDDLQQLKNGLSFRVTIAKETPYEITYTPLLLLTAEAKTPPDARITVNAWAEVVADAAKRFQDTVQGPAAAALGGRFDELTKELSDVELANEKFLTENNLDYTRAHLEEVVDLILTFEKRRTTLESDLAADKASIEGYMVEEANEEPKLSLSWKPSDEAVAMLGGKLGLPAPKTDSAAPEGAAPKSLVDVEHLNTVYWEVRGKLAATRAGVAGKEAERKELSRLIEQLETERLELQAQLARLETEKMRLARDLERVENAFNNVALKNEFARVAGLLDHPALQVISAGAEWPLPRFRRALLFGGAGFLWGLVLAACVSLGYRLAVKPAAEV